MSASLPPARRRRPRRGSLERPLNARLYRGAWLFSVVPLLLLAFTVSTPAPLVRPALPETFGTAAAIALTRDLAIGYPDRAPGTPEAGDGRPLGGASAWFLQQLDGYGLTESASSWLADVPGRGRMELTNITAVAPGQSPEAIVVMAHRDDLGIGPGADDNASGTAVLVELARAYAEPHGVTRVSVQPAHTLIFLSTDGGAFGGLGAVHFLATSPYRRRIAAVINLDALAGAGPPRIEIAGDRPRSPNATLLATAAARLRDQTGSAPAYVGVLGQLIDLGFPFTLEDQGPFNAVGIPALTLTTNDGRPPAAFGDTPDLLQVKRLGEMGEAAQELLGSLNQDVQLAPATASYVWAGGRTVRGWAIELLLISLLMPFAVTVVDFYALCRRNRIGLGPAMRALRGRLGFWLFSGAVFTCFRLLGAWPTGPARPPNPASPLSEHWPVLALVSLLIVLSGGWAVSRQRLAVRRRATAEEQLAGYLVALVALLLVALLVAATNPFALLFVLPALHVWLWLPQLRIARAPVRVFLFLLGLAGPGLLLASLAWRFGLGLDAVWYLVELIANGYVTTLAFVVALAGAAAASQLAAASAGRYAPYPTARERGPRGPLRELVRTIVRGGTGLRREVALRRDALGTYRAR
jgi:hypothetical protein